MKANPLFAMLTPACFTMTITPPWFTSIHNPRIYNNTLKPCPNYSSLKRPSNEIPVKKLHSDGSYPWLGIFLILPVKLRGSLQMSCYRHKLLPVDNSTHRFPKLQVFSFVAKKTKSLLHLVHCDISLVKACLREMCLIRPHRITINSSIRYLKAEFQPCVLQIQTNSKVPFQMNNTWYFN